MWFVEIQLPSQTFMDRSFITSHHAHILQVVCSYLYPDYPCRQCSGRCGVGGAAETLCYAFPLLFLPCTSPSSRGRPLQHTYNKVHNNCSFFRMALHRLQSTFRHLPTLCLACSNEARRHNRNCCKINPTLLQPTPPHPKKGHCKW